MLEFRWAAFIALWSMLIGPILDFSSPSPTHAQTKTAPARIPTQR